MNQGTGTGGEPNMPGAERKMIRTLRSFSVEYHVSDKMLGPVLYSRDLYQGLPRPEQTAPGRQEGNV